ncbi:hypothetical protein CCHL11_09895 [Colletotrichum chlorophyti]|uniref:Uncharacterized protein n=1 Tax=Colletotrichum chlorophyti TaxID=708187 RepID=A0A1Q8RD34_9PEZI|nr:hypothetical protein CCHL11_09895 [Colletotrichum chlorophyti]
MPSLPPSPGKRSRPRPTLHRCIVRLRDRVELFLERHVDGDPTSGAEYSAYKKQRDKIWMEEDQGKEAILPAAALLKNRAPIHATSGRITSADMPEYIQYDRVKDKESGFSPEIINRQGSAAKKTAAGRPRDLSRASTFSLTISSALGEVRRRRRKRSDARPGYFDPAPWPGTSERTNTGVGIGNEDHLGMNIPVELAKPSTAPGCTQDEILRGVGGEEEQ